MPTKKPLKLSIRSSEVAPITDKKNHAFVEKIIRQLPKKDTGTICAIVMDYEAGDIGRVTLNFLPSSVWSEIGKSRAKEILVNCKKEGRLDSITFNPIWKKDEKLSKYDVLHEVGHVVYNNLPVGVNQERQFWVDRANIEEISNKGVVLHLKEGHGSLVHEYFADHYARCKLSDKTIPKQERDKLLALNHQ